MKREDFSIKDLKDRDMSKVGAQALVEDWAIIARLYSELPSDKHTEAEIVDSAKGVHDEIVKRGLKFNPDTMKLDVRTLYDTVSHSKSSLRYKEHFVSLCKLPNNFLQREFNADMLKEEYAENIAKSMLKCLKCESTYLQIPKITVNKKLFQMGCVKCGHRFYVYDGRDKYQKIYVIENLQSKKVKNLPSWDKRFIDLLDEEKHFFKAMKGWYGDVTEYYMKKVDTTAKLQQRKNISPADADYSWTYLSKLLKVEMLAIALKGQSKGMTDIGKTPLKTLDKSTALAIDKYTMKLAKDVTSDVNASVKTAITEGLAAKKGVAEIRRDIQDSIKATVIKVKAKKVGDKVVRKSYTRLYPALQRARAIAQTETLRAVNMGRFEAYKEEPKLVRGWEFLTSGDDRVCIVCLGLEGTKYPLSDTTNMPPLHVKCRCTHIAILKHKFSAPEPIINLVALHEKSRLMKATSKLKDKLHNEKLATPLMTLPPKGKKAKFALQHHYRGKSVHADLRFEINGGLTGFTMFDAPAGAVKKDVTTLAQAKALEGQVSWKINNDEGMRGNKVQSEPKTAHPKDWLTAEGVLKKGEPGSTSKLYGVLSRFDKGWIEFGAQKSDYHEYFLHGKRYNGRWIFTKVTFPGREVWLGWKTKDQTPYVLSSGASSDNWVPPKGYSGMSRSWEVKVPMSMRWWNLNLTGARAREMIDTARKELKRQRLATYKFTLVKCTWKDMNKWALVLQMGEKALTIELESNPMFESKLTGVSKNRLDKEIITKIIDNGSAEIVEEHSDYMHLRFRGKFMKGVWSLKQDEGKNIWKLKRWKAPKPGLEAQIKQTVEALKEGGIQSKIKRFLNENKYRRLTIPVNNFTVERNEKYTWKGNVKMPIVIEGIAIEEGTWTGMSGSTVTYPGKVIWDSVPLFKGAQLRTDHNEDDPKKVIGWVVDSWKGTSPDGKKRVMFKALVFDPDMAKLLLKKKSFAVSMGVWTKEEIILGNNICQAIKIVDEISIVPVGACSTCKAKVNGHIKLQK